MRELPEIRHEILYGNRVVPCFADRPDTIDEMFRAAVSNHTERTALVHHDKRISYAELNDEVDRVASQLVHRGFTKNERVALLIGNKVEFVISFLAAARAGLISVPMNIRQRLPEVTFVLQQNHSSAIIVDADHATNVPAIADVPSLRNVFVVGDKSAYKGAEAFSDLSAPSAPVTFPEVGQEDTLCLLYTSGTTGHPKGAMLTNVSIIHSLIHFSWGFQLREGDVACLSVPVSHVTGLVALLLTTFYVGGTTVIMEEFKARKFLDLVAREQVNYTLMVPAMYNLCLLDPEFQNFDLSTWRVAGFGGAPMPQATITRLEDALPNLVLHNVYGSTETSSPVTLLPAGAIHTHPDTVGKVLPTASVIVVDDEGHEVRPGQAGELLIGGPMVVPGYWHNPRGNAEGFIQNYWVSGDIGSKDANGFVRVFDRKKDMINRAGFKIYCIEVENVLTRHPAVVEVSVVGRPDEVLGERVHAFIFNDGRPVTYEEIRAFCAERLSDYKVPDFVTFLDAPLPRNANGKVLKNVLRDLAVT